MTISCSVIALRVSRWPQKNKVQIQAAESHSSVGSVQDWRTGGRWFDPRLGQYSFRGLMIVIATEFIPLSPLSAVSAMVMWKSSKWLGKNIVRSTGKKNSRKACLHGYSQTLFNQSINQSK